MDAMDRAARIMGDIMARDPQAFHEALPYRTLTGLTVMVMASLVLYFIIKKYKKDK